MAAVGQAVSARPGDELPQVERLVTTEREQRRAIEELERSLAAGSVDALLDDVQEVDGVKVLAAVVEAADVDTLRDLSDRMRDKLGSAIVALGAVIGERPMLVVAATHDLVSRGLHAGKLAGAAARRMGGGGGGKPSMAQAGGRDAADLDKAVAAVPDLVAEALE
jgi:alanyl-tRNA synthetase